jgi:hypothetical protein
MKLRHAAALVTIGWYLMIPPGHLASPVASPGAHHRKTSALEPDPTAPLNGWYPVQSFSTEILCREGLRDLSSPTSAREHFMKRHRELGQHHFMARALKSGQCIAADDPRIKGMR